MWLIFTVTFLDFLAFSAIVPFIPLLFLDPRYHLFVSNCPMEWRYILLGLLFATYPLAQVLAAPILGHFSDKIGRKEVLLLSYVGNIVGYLCCGFGIFFSSVALLFMGNLIAGLFGANVSTVNAIITDLSHEHRRSRFFGISQLMLGLGFALGPYLSGRVFGAYANVYLIGSLFFFAASGVSLVNFLLVWLGFSHRKEKIEAPTFNFREIFRCSSPVKRVFWTTFLLIFGWYFFIKTFQVFLLEEVRCSEVEMFNTIAYYGLCTVLAQVLYVSFLHKYIKSHRFFECFLFLLAASIFSLVFVRSYAPLIFIVPLFSIAYSILMPSLTYLISESSENKGKLMGLNQSVQSLAKILAPALAGVGLALTPLTSVAVSSLVIFLGGVVFILKGKDSSYRIPFT